MRGKLLVGVMNKKFYFHVFKQLIRADLSGTWRNLIDKMINVSIWLTITLFIFSYIMQTFGLKGTYGVFQYASVIASMGLFEMFPSAVRLLSDFENEKTILYNLTLPIPSWVALLSKVFFYALNALALALCVIPVGKLILWNKLQFAVIAWPKLILLIFFASFFYGTLTLWLASMIPNMTQIQNIWMRCVFPLWFLGGFQFSWAALHKTLPVVAYIDLLNPIIYITEASRSTVLGQDGFINFWYCLLAIMVLTGFFLYYAIRNLKKRLDFV